MIVMKRKGKISASMMCTSIDKIFYYLTEFKKAEIEYLHIDVMDGDFVPNFALGTDYVKSLRRISDIPFDFHFLVNDPLTKMTWFDINEGDRVAFHYEGNKDIDKCLDYLKRLGAEAYIAINPETDFHVLDKYLNDIDGILVMTVNPGFAGKKLVESTIDKVKQMEQYYKKIDRKDLSIEVDGNMTLDNSEIFYKLGADTFVAGSSSLFKNTEVPVSKTIEEMRKRIGW